MKRTLAEKEPEIHQIEDEGKRYYPPSAAHKFDEWGALQRHREEQTRIIKEQEKRRMEEQKQNYDSELSEQI